MGQCHCLEGDSVSLVSLVIITINLTEKWIHFLLLLSIISLRSIHYLQYWKGLLRLQIQKMLYLRVENWNSPAKILEFSLKIPGILQKIPVFFSVIYYDVVHIYYAVLRMAINSYTIVPFLV